MFYDIVNALCKERKTSITRMAEEIGLSNAAPTSWKKGAVPKLGTLKKISEYFGVSVEYLLGEEQKEKPSDQTTGERSKSKLRSVARLEDSQITPEQDQQIADYIDFLLSKKKKDS